MVTVQHVIPVSETELEAMVYYDAMVYVTIPFSPGKSGLIDEIYLFPPIQHDHFANLLGHESQKLIKICSEFCYNENGSI